MKDYYKILGIKPSATPTEIKKAYRQLAMQYHPDKNPDPYAEAQFKEVQEAYSTLADPLLRERYDDECWLSGMSRKSQYAQAVTPAWLLTVAKDLNKSLAGMDTHRMSHNALQAYILLILSDAHIGILKQYNDEEKNTAIITEIIKAAKWLHIKYIPEVTDKLQVLAGAGTTESRAVADFRIASERQALTQKLYPYIVLAVTLALCVFMYFYGTLTK